MSVGNGGMTKRSKLQADLDRDERRQLNMKVAALSSRIDVLTERLDGHELALEENTRVAREGRDSFDRLASLVQRIADKLGVV